MKDYVAELIARFGGVRPMARHLGLSPQTVGSWKARKSIPAKYHPAIVNKALTLDPPLRLGPADFSNLGRAA